MIRKILRHAVLVFGFASLLFAASPAFSQTSAFTYQGRIEVSGAPANGAYDLQFKLFDILANGLQQGPTVTLDDVQVTGGIFTVSLDFGAGAFTGASRFLEVSIRAGAESGAYTTLAPRQQVVSTPYAIKSLNATSADSLSASCVGCVTSNQIGSVAGGAISGSIPVASVPAGSPSYVQNTTVVQANSNFNVSGEGKANKLTAAAVNATSEFQQGGGRVLYFNAANSGFVGLLAGPNATGSDNMFVGYNAGNAATTGSFNAFFGSESGKQNQTGFNNSFYGAASGRGNTSGTNNAFFGANAGLGSNGSFNAFFGSNAGFTNIGGTDNSFFGSSSGLNNTNGNANSLFGRSAGKSLTTGFSNALFGAYAGENTTTAGNAYFGAFAGQKNTTGFNNVFVGLNAGKENTVGSFNIFIGANSGANAGASGSNNMALGNNAKVGLSVNNATAIGANAFAGSSNSVVLGTGIATVEIPGGLAVSGTATFNGATVNGNLSVANGFSVGNKLVVDNQPDVYISSIKTGDINSNNNVKASQLLATNAALTFSAAGGTESVCIKPSSDITPEFPYRYLAHCSSSIRYKDNVQTYARGLDLITRLRPVTFNWKSGGKLDVGFIAEEVNEVEPLLNNYNNEGQVEGVKYAQITTALVNAVKEQQAIIDRQQQRGEQQAAQIRLQQQQIEAQQKAFARQQQEIDALKQLARHDGRTPARRSATGRK